MKGRTVPELAAPVARGIVPNKKHVGNRAIRRRLTAEARGKVRGDRMDPDKIEARLTDIERRYAALTEQLEVA